jgi:hypothetical protein
MLNFIPVGTKFFLYQAAEYDSRAPAARARGLTYLFANVRYAPVQALEFRAPTTTAGPSTLAPSPTT